MQVFENFTVQGDGNGGILAASVSYLKKVVVDGELVSASIVGPRPVPTDGKDRELLDSAISSALVAAAQSNNQIAEKLSMALADMQRITEERDGLQSRVAALDAEANALRAENEALKAPKPILRVPTAALLIVVERRELTARLDAIRAALPENQQREFELYLKMPYTRRDHPLIAMVQQAFGWTDAEVDALFAEADLV
jgi:hypothetical protein